jgi:hypothetical protein
VADRWQLELHQRNVADEPGINDTWGTYVSAYELRPGAAIRWTVAPWSDSEMPSTDYLCQSRGQNDWNTRARSTDAAALE